VIVTDMKTETPRDIQHRNNSLLRLISTSNLSGKKKCRHSLTSHSTVYVLHSNICDAHPIPFLSDRHYYDWCCWNVSRKSITSFVTQDDATGGDFHDINPEIYPRMSYFLLKKLLTLSFLYYHVTPSNNPNKIDLTT